MGKSRYDAFFDRARQFCKKQIEFIFGGRLVHGVAVGLGSKLIGFVRDLLIPNLLGVTLTADLFVLGMRITLYARSVIGDNLWIALLVPRLAFHAPETDARQSIERRLWTKAASGVLLIEWIAMPARVLAIFDSLFFHFMYSRNAFDQVLFYVILSLSLTPLLLGCIMLALLHGRNLVLSANSIAGWSNIVFVIFLILTPLLTDESIKLFLLAMSFVAASVFQLFAAKLLLKLRFCWRRVMRDKINFGEGGRPLAQILLVAAGLSLQSLPSLTVTLAAVMAPHGTVTVLYLAQRLVMLFPTLVALPMAALMFPELTAVLRRAEFGAARKYVNRGLLQGVALSAIGCAITIAAIWPVSQLVFMASDIHAIQYVMFKTAVLLLLPIIPLVFTMQILQRFLRAYGSDWDVFFSGLAGCTGTALFIVIFIRFEDTISINALACALTLGTTLTVIYMLFVYFFRNRLQEFPSSK